MVKLPSKSGVVGSIPGFSSLLDETLNQDPMTIFQDKLLTRKDCDEAGDNVVPNVLSTRELVFRPDLEHKLYQHRMRELIFLPYSLLCGSCSEGFLFLLIVKISCVILLWPSLCLPYDYLR